MKICCISDTHEKHEAVKVPSCDLLIFAGDFTMSGRPSRTVMALEWLNNQPAKHIVAVAGNHDYFFEKHPESARDLLSQTRIKYLEDNQIEIDGFKIWGSPYTKKFHDWAFMYDPKQYYGSRYGRWGMIPLNTDILITHGPPFGILDQCVPYQSEFLGCPALRDAVGVVRPKLHVFGHIHGSSGSQGMGETIFVNASILNEDYEVANEPRVIEL